VAFSPGAIYFLYTRERGGLPPCPQFRYKEVDDENKRFCLCGVKGIGHLIYLLIGLFLLFRSKESLKFVEKLRKEGIGKHISEFLKKLRRE
jgi:hypothetical protein